MPQTNVARCSQYNEAKLYKLFGVNAELLIDRAWGREPTTIADVKAYVLRHRHPRSHRGKRPV